MNNKDVYATDHQLHLLAPAKVNLTLEIVGRRPDGYHLLETVMQSIDLADIVTVKVHDVGTTVYSNGSDVPNGDGNLAARALTELQSEVAGELASGHRLPGLQVHIDKRIPVAAGLGGGSADAAAALVAANELWNLHMDKGRLAAVGVRIGADVPFCLYGGTAVARGIGEQLTAISDVVPLSGVVVNPGFPVVTAKVYGLFSEMTGAKPGDLWAPTGRSEAMIAALRKGDPGEVAGLLYNALEAVTTTLYPAIGQLRQHVLDVGALGAVMCGSGPSVFGLARDTEHAAVLAARLEKVAPYIAITRFLPCGGHIIGAERCV